MQLGGPRVMGVNGVSHHVVADDLEGVKVRGGWRARARARVCADFAGGWWWRWGVCSLEEHRNAVMCGKGS